MRKEIILGGGCFWCLEAVFQRVKGVVSVQSGYAGGHMEQPDYRSVCAETSGHAEVVKIEYNSDCIQLNTLLDIFFTIHDPTSLNRQGNDQGTQYRSVIYYNVAADKAVIDARINHYQTQFTQPIVTEVRSQQTFWPCEDYHNNYFNHHQQQPYCHLVIGEKIDKLKRYFENDYQGIQ